MGPGCTETKACPEWVEQSSALPPFEGPGRSSGADRMPLWPLLGDGAGKILLRPPRFHTVSAKCGPSTAEAPAHHGPRPRAIGNLNCGRQPSRKDPRPRRRIAGLVTTDRTGTADLVPSEWIHVTRNGRRTVRRPFPNRHYAACRPCPGAVFRTRIARQGRPGPDSGSDLSILSHYTKSIARLSLKCGDIVRDALGTVASSLHTPDGTTSSPDNSTARFSPHSDLCCNAA